MKNFILLFLFVPLFSLAQKTHTVAPKETLYSLARKYNVHPRELADYNNISVQTGLTIGQVIKIPPKTNLPPLKESTTAVAAEPVKKSISKPEAGNTPIYHKVEKKETLYHISKTYHVTVDDIKKWNHLTTDGVSEGVDLIVGYGASTKQVADVKPAVKENKEVKKEEPKKEVAEKPVEIEPAKPVVEPKQEIKSPPVVKEKPVVIEDRPVLPTPASATKTEPAKTTGKNFEGGFFKQAYEKQISTNKDTKEETGTAGIFKSTSGWEDGKYYCLHNTAPAGSIVKITNKATQKAVYAKVLDVIPDLKQNNGIMLRISNAAADELGAGENNFEATVNY